MLQDAGFNLYGYVPNMAANIIMLVVFALSTVVHTWQVVRYRQWWLLLLPVGTMAEVGGYIPYVYIIFQNADKLDDSRVTTIQRYVTPTLQRCVYLLSLLVCLQLYVFMFRLT